MNGLNFSRGDGETIFGKNVAEVFNYISGEMTFVRAGIKSMLLELLDYFVDMFSMFLGVIREDQDVIEIDNDSNIEKIFEDVVHETLESGRCINQTKGHDTPFNRAIASIKVVFHLSPSAMWTR